MRENLMPRPHTFAGPALTRTALLPAVVEAALCLSAARVLLLAPYAVWSRTLGDGVTWHRADTSTKAAASRLVPRAIAVAAARMPVAMVCLPRAMAAHWMLRRRGVASVLHLGIRHVPGNGHAVLHAWLTVDGETLLGGAGAEGFVTLRRYG